VKNLQLEFQTKERDSASIMLHVVATFLLGLTQNKYVM